MTTGRGPYTFCPGLLYILRPVVVSFPVRAVALLELPTTLAGARLVATDLLSISRVRGWRNLRLSRDGWGLLHDEIVDNLLGSIFVVCPLCLSPSTISKVMRMTASSA